MHLLPSSFTDLRAPLPGANGESFLSKFFNALKADGHVPSSAFFVATAGRAPTRGYGTSLREIAYSGSYYAKTHGRCVRCLRSFWLDYSIGSAASTSATGWTRQHLLPDSGVSEPRGTVAAIASHLQADVSPDKRVAIRVAHLAAASEAVLTMMRDNAVIDALLAPLVLDIGGTKLLNVDHPWNLVLMCDSCHTAAHHEDLATSQFCRAQSVPELAEALERRFEEVENVASRVETICDGMSTKDYLATIRFQTPQMFASVDALGQHLDLESPDSPLPPIVDNPTTILSVGLGLMMAIPVPLATKMAVRSGYEFALPKWLVGRVSYMLSKHGSGALGAAINKTIEHAVDCLYVLVAAENIYDGAGMAQKVQPDYDDDRAFWHKLLDQLEGCFARSPWQDYRITSRNGGRELPQAAVGLHVLPIVELHSNVDLLLGRIYAEQEKIRAALSTRAEGMNLQTAMLLASAYIQSLNETKRLFDKNALATLANQLRFSPRRAPSPSSPNGD